MRVMTSSIIKKRPNTIYNGNTSIKRHIKQKKNMNKTVTETNNLLYPISVSCVLKYLLYQENLNIGKPNNPNAFITKLMKLFIIDASRISVACVYLQTIIL